MGVVEAVVGGVLTHLALVLAKRLKARMGWAW